MTRATGTNEQTRIARVSARQVLDSRGNPTIEAEVETRSGAVARAIVPSGASTGRHEALELRDGERRIYRGLGVLRAVANVEGRIGPKIVSFDCRNQEEIDGLMIELDGTKDKSKLGANSILSVSMAVARAAAASEGEPLYAHLHPMKKYRLPIPMMNVINGGKHAGSKLAVQEFLIEPVGAKSMGEAIRFGDDVYHSLRSILKKKHGDSSVNVGDEGGFAPSFQTSEQALDAIADAISAAGLEQRVRLGIDPAASNFFNEKTSTYRIDGDEYEPDELLDYYVQLAKRYRLLTIEDPFEEDAYASFQAITRKLGSGMLIIGDDLYVTNRERIRKGISLKATNAVLIKLNQIGTVTETLEAVRMSRAAGMSTIVSHRSGETEDTFISHLATAVESDFIKTGAPARGERVAKYNELLRIEEELGDKGYYPGFPQTIR